MLTTPHRSLIPAFRILLTVLALSLLPQATHAAPAYTTPDALIAAVNDLREANGISPYTVDPILMEIAQAHSDYQASIDTVTHTGSDGTSPKDRGATAGYGGGAIFFLSENIAAGNNLDVATVISFWLDDAPHRNTMLSPSYTHIGVGVTIKDDAVYYTLNVGYISGSAGTGSSSNGNPVLVATPREDGSVLHKVAVGQTMWTIAVSYSIPLETLLAINGMDEDSVIFPGDEIYIVPPYTPTPTKTALPPTVTPTSTNFPTRTPRPTRTPAPDVSPTPELSTTQETAPPAETELTLPTNDTMRTALIALVGVAGVLALIGALRDRSKKE